MTLVGCLDSSLVLRLKYRKGQEGELKMSKKSQIMIIKQAGILIAALTICASVTPVWAQSSNSSPKLNDGDMEIDGTIYTNGESTSYGGDALSSEDSSNSSQQNTDQQQTVSQNNASISSNDEGQSDQ